MDRRPEGGGPLGPGLVFPPAGCVCVSALNPERPRRVCFKVPARAALGGRRVECRRRESCGGRGVDVFQRKKERKTRCGALTKMGGGGTKWGEVGRSGVDVLWCCPLSEIFPLKPKLLDK